MLFALWLTLSVFPFDWTPPAFAAPSGSPTSTNTSKPSYQQNDWIHKWSPTHQQIWTPDVQRTKVTQYADWDRRHVTVYQPTNCTQGSIGSWTIPSIGLQGEFTVTGTFSRIPIDLPPYIDDFRLIIECDDMSLSTTWMRDSSLPIPTLYWKYSTDGSFETLLHNGQSISLHVAVQQRYEDDWQELVTLSALHPLETWTLPALTAEQIRLQVMSEDTILFEHTTELRHSHLIYEDLRGRSTTSLVEYEGVWRWFSAPVWETSNAHHLFTVLEPFNERSHVPFLRWNDTLLIEDRSWKTGRVESSSTWIHGDPYQDTDIPLLISPEDQLNLQTATLSLMNSHININISTSDAHSTVHTSQQFLRTGVQASDDRLVSLLPLVFSPLTPQTSARLLHGAALFWNPLHTRDLPWFNRFLDATRQALRFLENLSDTTWTSLDNQTRLFIVWASLIADREGLSPSSSFMRRNLDWLCGVDNTNTIEMAMLLAHVRWMITQSYWKHRSCDNKDSIQITNHPLAKPHIKIINTVLNKAWERKILPKLPAESEEWMHWLLLEQEQQMKDRYVNLSLTLQSESTSYRGLFHEWQVRPLNKTIHDSDTWTLSVKGVGRLYTSRWIPSSTSFVENDDVHLQVERKILTMDGKPFAPLECEQGQAIQIQTRVQTTPDTPFCIRQWSAAGLSNNRTPESHFCTISDNQGQWNDITHTYILFDGRFRLPTTMVATENEFAHTKTVWFETRQYKELMSE